MNSLHDRCCHRLLLEWVTVADPKQPVRFFSQRRRCSDSGHPQTIKPFPRVISAVELANGIAMRYEFIWESDKYLWVKFFGAIDGIDVNNATNGLYNDFRLDSLQGVLWDFSGINSFDVTDIDAEEIAYTDFAASHYKRNMKAAFITQNPGLAKLTKLYIETMNGLRCPWENRLFDNVEEARRWSFG